jgi:hypothetical protein
MRRLRMGSMMGSSSPIDRAARTIDRPAQSEPARLDGGDLDAEIPSPVENLRLTASRSRQ